MLKALFKKEKSSFPNAKEARKLAQRRRHKILEHELEVIKRNIELRIEDGEFSYTYGYAGKEEVMYLTKALEELGYEVEGVEPLIKSDYLEGIKISW